MFSNKVLLISLMFYIIFGLIFFSSLIFIIFFFLLTLDFVCSSFSCSFRWHVRLFIWDFSFFLRNACITINLLLTTIFDYHIYFGKLYFYFHLSQVVFWLPLWYLCWHICFFSSTLFRLYWQNVAINVDIRKEKLSKFIAINSGL